MSSRGWPDTSTLKKSKLDVPGIEHVTACLVIEYSENWVNEAVNIEYIRIYIHMYLILKVASEIYFIIFQGNNM